MNRHSDTANEYKVERRITYLNLQKFEAGAAMLTVASRIHVEKLGVSVTFVGLCNTKSSFLHPYTLYLPIGKTNSNEI